MPYVYTENVIAAINVALATGRPLLVSGPPGSGKSSVARSVAELSDWRFLSFQLSSRTEARDLLWTFDDIRRLHDAQIARELPHSESYVKRGVLWEAFESTPRAVVLLDDVDRASPEIDEALVAVLGSLSFLVEETGQVVKARGDDRPFVVVTTTDERRLARQFDRRCVRLQLYPPSLELLVAIASAHGLADNPELVKRVAEAFARARDEADRRNVAPPEISEYLDVLRACLTLGLEPLDSFIDLLTNDRFTDRTSNQLLPDTMESDHQLPRRRTNDDSDGPVVFLCHSSDDKAAVRALYAQLVRDGLRPWLDEQDLMPGQDWRRAIAKAIDDADFVLVCLSRSSIVKRGYLQREIKAVLDVADEMPEGRVYVVPARLEECDVPEQLERWQWVNLYEPDGYARLLKTAASLSGAH